MTIQVKNDAGDMVDVYRSELIEILRDYGDIENEDYYPEMSDTELVNEFIRAARSGRERDYVRESAEDNGWEWNTLVAS
ncbi:hypothetical protein BKG82_26735 [Mycobacteroides chelonae]|uniref:Uncharacterized protein n=1 Tax=Mycobacteroides chelonae TaxID=1774 RepID=A0A1S1LKY6_MYCCH|nr:hypothetical protein [Mycobacteroides chelonae]OHU47254.1 hypothetical protein BKG82_26735 [Mycobacteroides chelonae]